MSFSGKYEVESEENYDNFMKRIGLPADVIEKGRTFKIVTEVAQNGDEFTWSQIYPGGKSITNTFVIGKEGDMETLGGKKFKLSSLQAEGCNSIHIYLGLSLIEFGEAYFQATLKMEGGKVVGDFPNYHYTAEIAGDKLVEISTVGEITFKRTSKRVA